MTPQQRELARHALGLGAGQRRSYRNRFLAAIGSRDYAEWTAMVAEGCAERAEPRGAFQWFWLTRKGAEAALTKREILCPEDFPTPEQERPDHG